MTDQRSPAKIIAGCTALCGFSVALLSSILAEVTAETALTRAILALVVCYAVGAAVGMAGTRCIREYLESSARPRPGAQEEIPQPSTSTPT
ncbi:MAG: hypothetical protein J0L61_12030 [Planctomycetes bacterium]|nr:hypothetical protein [Planctomycetota bacterium]